MHFVHPELNADIRTAGGHYRFTGEFRMPHQGRSVLVLVGYGVADSACCGPGGCGYALVPGFVVEWKCMFDDGGRPISRVNPIEDPEVRDALRRRIMDREPVQQVNFL